MSGVSYSGRPGLSPGSPAVTMWEHCDIMTLSPYHLAGQFVFRPNAVSHSTLDDFLDATEFKKFELNCKKLKCN